MNIDFWVFTVDANGAPKASASVPAVAASANIVAISVVSAGTGVYSARARLRDGAQVASALMSWSVDSIGYVQQVVFSRGLLDVNAATVSATSAAAIATQVKADPPEVTIAAASITEIAALDAVGIGSGGASEVTTTELSAFQGETVEQTITAYLADGVTPLDLSGLTLEMVWESSVGTFLAVIENANITISGAGSNLVTFAYPAAVTRSAGTKLWSLRDAADASKVRLNGTLLVSKAAINTSD